MKKHKIVDLITDDYIYSEQMTTVEKMIEIRVGMWLLYLLLLLGVLAWLLKCLE